MPSNTLVQYKGGGYDGCHWEWNFCYYDDAGQWRNIFSSGRLGCQTKEQWESYKKRIGECYFYDLKNKGWEGFCREAHISLVVGVGAWLQKNWPSQDFPFSVPCEECGMGELPSLLVSTSYRGDGGIGIMLEDYVCDDCYRVGSCPNCGEYFNREERDFCSEENYCKYCHENCCYERRLEKQEQEKIEDREA